MNAIPCHAAGPYQNRDRQRYSLHVEELENRLLLAADVFEPNDSFATAFDLVTGDQTHTGLTIHEAQNDDWYRWTAPASGTLNLDLIFSHAAGDLDLQLYDSSQTFLASSTSATDNEYVVVNVVTDQTYYVRAYGYNGATNPSYTLAIDGPGSIPLDGFEPNESFGTAWVLGQGDQQHVGLTVQKTGEFSSSDDWYKWTASENGLLTVDIRFVHALGDLDLKFFDASQTLLVTSASASDDETVSYSVVAGESYFIQVYGYSGARNPDYDLLIDGPDIVPDIFEPNDSFGAAWDLGRGDLGLSGLTIHTSGNDDFYLWTADEDGTLNVDVSFLHAQGDLDAQILDSGQNVLAASTSSTDDEQLTTAVTAGASYVIRIYGFSGSVNRDYALVIDGPDIVADYFEPNDSFEQAIDLGYFNQSRSGLGIHQPGNEDWFGWTALNGGTLELDVLFSNAAGNLDMELYDENQTLLASALSVTDDEHLSWDVNAGDEYFVRVFSDTLDIQPDYRFLVTDSGQSENYAVLFSGGIDKKNNHKRYYDATRDLYETLTDTAGLNIDPDNIFVLFGDGTNNAVDRSDGANSDMSFATNVLAATPANLQTVLTTTIADQIDSNDQFLFWSFDHGNGKHPDASRSYNYSKNAPTITDEEELMGWGQDISDNDLASWLNQVPAGRATVVYSQCFAGGMLDNLLPMAQTGFGMAATNHYEFSYGDDFASAFNEALEKGHTNTYDAFLYAQKHDASAAKFGTYTGNGGTYQWGVEHPWSATTTNFPIFADTTNNAPLMVAIDPIGLPRTAEDLRITHDLLRAASSANDPDGEAVGFRIESLDIGTLTKGGEPVIPGETLVSYGESLLWVKPEGVDGLLDAFSVRAYDGVTISDQRVFVPIRIDDPAGTLLAVDDTAEIQEDDADVPISVLDNDDGSGGLTVTGVGEPEYGSVRLTEGVVRYTPLTDWFGEDSFTYFVADSTGETAWARVVVTVLAANDPPEVVPDQVIVLQDSSDNVLDVLANDFDADFDPLLARQVTGPSHGTLVDPVATVQIGPWHGDLELNPEGSFRYTPQAGYVGTDSFTYVANDGLADSNEVTVSIDIEPRPDELPDLIVTDVWEEANTVHYQVRNIGTADAEAGHFAVLSVNGTYIAGDQIGDDLEPGQRWSGTFDEYLWAAELPTDTVRVEADYSNDVAEDDETNNVLQEAWQADMAAPVVLTGPTVTDVTEIAATIQWETDEPSDSVVRYGAIAGQHDATASDPTLVTFHSVDITGLDPSGTYHFIVESADASGNRVTSRDVTFQTWAEWDGIVPEVSLIAPDSITGAVRITAPASDDTGTEKVEFYLDDALTFIDYASPYEYTLDSLQLDNGLYTLKVVAFDEAGNSSEADQQIDISNLVPPQDVTAPTVTITSPTADATVSGTITVNASLSDDTGLSVARLYIDGAYTAFYPFPGQPTSESLQFSWDTTEADNGGHRIGVVVFDKDAKSTTATVDVIVDNAPPPPPPKLIVTNHTATRNQNVFEIQLTVKNVGAGTATNVVVEDFLDAFQPIAGTTIPAVAENEVQHNPFQMTWDTVITGQNDIPAGGSVTYLYLAIPVMAYPNPPTPSIGDATYLFYEGLDGTDYTGQVSLPVSHTTTNVSIATAHANALKEADYLLTTNPLYLYSHYSTGTVARDDLNTLLSDMAQLALFEQGALGYLYTNATTTRNALDKLIEPNGGWAKQLDADFSKSLGGYMLIVGETEIVPAWSEPGFVVNNITVPLSDHPYADTGGDGRPELIVGRIIGDDPATLSKPLQASYARFTGASGYAFDRDNALLISGPGKGTFVQDVKDVGQVLQNEFNVTEMHWKDYYIVSSFSRDFEQNDGFAAGDVLGGTTDEIVIADDSANKVFLYDANGVKQGEFAVPWWAGKLQDGFAVGDVVGDGKAEIIMADSSANIIRVYDDTGGYVTFFFDFDAFDGLTTGDVTGDAKEEIIIADRSANKIYLYNTTGTQLGVFNRDFEKGDGLATGNLAGTAKDEIIVGDFSAKSIVFYNASGSELGSHTLGTRGYPPDIAMAGFTAGRLDGGTTDRIVSASVKRGYTSVYRWNDTTDKLDLAGDIPFDYRQYDGIATGETGDIMGRVQDELFIADQDTNTIFILDKTNYRQRVTDALPVKTRDQDVLYWAGHGNTNLWSPLNSYVYNPLPVDFNGHNPFIMAMTCLSGNYERGSQENNNIAESFFDLGASVYIGATEESAGDSNRQGSKMFYQKWQPYQDIGKTFTQIEQSVWSGNAHDKWWMWVWQYNIYGDPKFGAEPPGILFSEFEGADVPPPELNVIVPDYTVTPEFDLDVVDIPGGNLWLEDGDPWIPYYSVDVEYPAGYQVQDVLLVERSGLTTGTGLNIPVNPDEPIACLCDPQPSPGTDEWFPEESRTYDWETIENADGSTTLRVTLFPFYYNARTTDVQFYRDYTFDINATVTEIAVTALTTDADAYDSGDPVLVQMEVSNAGAVEDVVVETVVRRYGSNETVAGLRVDTLTGLIGNASFTAEWDSAASEPGLYYVETTLRDPSGILLGRRMEGFRIGQASVDVAGLTVTPDSLTPDVEAIDISMSVQNTGLVEVTDASMVLRVFNLDGELVLESANDLTSLGPAETVQFSDSLDLSGLGPQAYRVVAYVAYDSLTSDPVVADVNRLGDMDVNGRVDFDDIDDFVLGLNNAVAYEDRYGVPPAVNGDIDQSGHFDFDDIDDFVATLVQGSVANRSSAVTSASQPAIEVVATERVAESDVPDALPWFLVRDEAVPSDIGRLRSLRSKGSDRPNRWYERATDRVYEAWTRRFEPATLAAARGETRHTVQANVDRVHGASTRIAPDGELDVRRRLRWNAPLLQHAGTALLLDAIWSEDGRWFERPRA